MFFFVFCFDFFFVFAEARGVLSFSPSSLTSSDPTASFVVSGFGLAADFSVFLELGNTCSTPVVQEFDVSAGNSVSVDRSELSVVVGGAGVSPAGQYSVCVQLGSGRFVKVGASTIAVGLFCFALFLLRRFVVECF